LKSGKNSRKTFIKKMLFTETELRSTLEFTLLYSQFIKSLVLLQMRRNSKMHRRISNSFSIPRELSYLKQRSFCHFMRFLMFRILKITPASKTFLQMIGSLIWSKRSSNMLMKLAISQKITLYFIKHSLIT